MEIKEVLHFYIGQQVLCSGFEFIGEPQPDVTAIIDSVHQECVTFVTDNGTTVGDYYFDDPEFNIKPILRKLSDMTEEEFEEFKKLSDQDFSKMVLVDAMCTDNSYTRLCHSAFAQQFLLSKGFDIFGLIDAGLAIDNKSI